MAEISIRSAWEDRRVIIASMFLPVAPDEPTSTPFSPAAVDVSSSSLSLENIAHPNTPAISIPLHPLKTTFTATNSGNPGLYKAIASIKNEIGPILWIGTVGTSTDHLNTDQKQKLSDRLYNEHESIPVFVTDEELHGHYHQFCKQVLWQPFHYQFGDYMKSRSKEDESWKMYKRVNELFALKVVEVYCPGDIIWINDYHLMLVPELVRKLKPEATIGFFLHIPFPSSEIFRCLHVRKEILMGLMGADLVGFQMYPFMRHFLMTSSRILGLDSTPKSILLENSIVAVGSFPIGIDIERLNERRNDPKVSEYIELLREKFKGKHIMIGRDKNDYVKGLAPKFLAFEKFLERHPEWQGKVVLIQVSLSTSNTAELASNVTDICARINSRFGTLEYAPVVYLQQDISFEYYLALLTVADACIITSLRDGMNLTSHEYIVCQDERHSPLIISEFAGTYGNFGAALRINPWDTTETANAINDALIMSDEEKFYRWKSLYSYITSNTSKHYVKTFLSDVVLSHNENLESLSTSIPRCSFKWMSKSYNSATKRFLFLDDDGTIRTPQYLRRFSQIPIEEDRFVKILSDLCADDQNCVYLMSSRKRDDLEPYFDISGLGISAESGCFVKFCNKQTWERLDFDLDLNWRPVVREVFQYYTDRTPGSVIEEKEIGIAWHYNIMDLKYGEWQASELQNHISYTLQKYPIHVLRRKNCIEVYLKNVSKASALRRIFQHHQHMKKRRRNSISIPTPETSWGTTDLDNASNNNNINPVSSDFTIDPEVCDFILCLGDDRSDEYMFEFLQKSFISNTGTSSRANSRMGSPTVFSPNSLPRNLTGPCTRTNLFTCTVGCKSSAAKWHIPSIEEALKGLELLAEL